jgi:prepilin-type N-terminal cleavage/methylation domain-containing protein
MSLLKNNKLSNNQIIDNKSPKNNSRKIQAFSLIELSIVILIIGILVAGVTSSSRLIRRMKVVTAQNLTRNSPVSSIKDLSMWYETSLDESFNNDEESDGSAISVWYDINIQSSIKTNVIPPAVANRPKFTENAINGLPVVRFDGVDDYLRADMAGISGPKITYFAVANRNSFRTEISVITGFSNEAYHDFDNVQSFMGFYATNGGGELCSHRASAKMSTLGYYPANGVNYVGSAVFNGSTNIIYYNGVASSAVASSGNFKIDKLFIGGRYVSGNFSNSYFGDIAEVIIFSRSLNDEERKSVEQYLGKKYGIKVS